MSVKSMNQCVVLQIGGTRFVITCNYPPFMSWLAEKCGGFISQGEPHLRLDLRIDSAPSYQRSGYLSYAIYITVTGYKEKRGRLKLRVACPHRANLFAYLLQICLRCAIAAKHPPDLLLHSAGIVREGMVYLFPGPSGAGKSTLCKLLASDSSFTILQDEMIAITQTEEGFRAWSTPVWGEMPAKYGRGAPLRAVFFLKHDRTNYATRLSGRKAAELICLSLVPPYIATNGRLRHESSESLGQALTLAEYIPCYELHFRPERSFWQCIPQLFEEESAAALGKV